MNPLQKWFFKKAIHKNPIYNESKIHKIMQKSWHLFKETYFASLCCLLLMLLFILLFKIYFTSLDMPTSQTSTVKKDYWGQTGIDLSTLQSIINQKTCYKELVNFLGCMQALTAIVTLTSDKEVHLDIPSYTTKDITQLSDIHIQPLMKKSFRDVNDVLKDFKKSMAEKLQYWETLYEKTQKHPIHFYQILADTITPYNLSHTKQKTPHNYWLQGLLKSFFNKTQAHLKI